MDGGLRDGSKQRGSVVAKSGMMGVVLVGYSSNVRSFLGLVRSLGEVV